MPDPRQITDLPVAASAEDADLLLMRQGATDNQVTVTNLRAPLMRKSANLSDVASAATARTNLDVPQISATLLKSDNLSGIASAATARTNLGLGTAAVATVGTSTGQLPRAEDINGLVERGAEVFQANDTFTVPDVDRVFFIIQPGSGGGGGGGGTGGANDGADGGNGSVSYIEDDVTSNVVAGSAVGGIGVGGEGGYDDGKGGRGGIGGGAPGQHGNTGFTGVTGAYGGSGGHSPDQAWPSIGGGLTGIQAQGGDGGAGDSGAGGGGGGGCGRTQYGYIDTSARQGDLWNIIVGSGGTGGAAGTGGGGTDGTDGDDGYVILWW